MKLTMTRWLYSIAAAIAVLSTFYVANIVTADGAYAQRRFCIQRTCVRRAPFVCPGPIGSCGFQQGRCLRWQTRRVLCGRPPVVR